MKQKYIYKVLPHKKSPPEQFEKELNQMANGGWDVLFVDGHITVYRFRLETRGRKKKDGNK